MAPKSFLTALDELSKGNLRFVLSDVAQAAIAAGTFGEPGATGATGPQGIPGAGMTWLGAWDGAVLYLEGDGVSRNGSSYLAILDNVGSAPPSANWDLIAAQGSTGSTGATGVQGIQGPPGATGDDGEDGIPGPPGVAGSAGVAGAPGAAGAMGIGVPGMDGDDGEQGYPGVPGVAGAAGSIGPTGPQGPAGFGVPGQDGEDGQDGWYVSPGGIYLPLTGGALTGALSIGTLTSGRIVLAGASGLLRDDANLTWDGTSLVSIHDWPTSVATNLAFNVTSYGDASRFTIRRANGTTALPSQVLLADVLGTLNFRGYHSGGAFHVTGAGAIGVTAVENFTPTAMGTYMSFATTPIGSITQAFGMVLDSTGNLGIGVITPGAITAVLHLKAGTATASTAPLKFTVGVNLTVPESGACEWDGERAYLTKAAGPTRKTVAYVAERTPAEGETVPAGMTHIVARSYKIASGKKLTLGLGAIMRIL